MPTIEESKAEKPAKAEKVAKAAKVEKAEEKAPAEVKKAEAAAVKEEAKQPAISNDDDVHPDLDPEEKGNSNVNDVDDIANAPTRETPKGTVVKSSPEVKAAVAPREKMVAVSGIVDHTCKIGGVEHAFKKGDNFQLPHGTATILQRAGKLYITG